MRILALTNLYPNPYQPYRATFNRLEFRALAKLHSLALISPIAWTDELACQGKRAASLPRDRRILLDGITVDYPRYLFTPKVLRPAMVISTASPSSRLSIGPWLSFARISSTPIGLTPMDGRPLSSGMPPGCPW